MNRDDIIRMAREAGFKVGDNLSGITLVGAPNQIGLSHLTVDELAIFAALVEAEKDKEIAALREEAGAMRSILGYALRGAVWEDKLICYCDDEDRVQHYRVEIRLPVPESAADKSPEAALARLIEQETALRREEQT